ncbi:MAG TPA: SAM-dependent methyltransferase [Novosphingobium sp.]
MNDAGSLTAIFRRLIETQGPITLAHYMGEANARYYASCDPLGAAGDFVTAPEISQMFGELMGLWLADIWIRAGRPEPVHYVELGPGRGTLARDALRAAARAGLSPQIHLVEASPPLRAVQAEALPTAHWHRDLSTLPADGPLLLLANEFLDALPVRQLVNTGHGWRERMVGWRDGRFAPVAGSRPMDAAVPAARREAAEGTIIETCPGAAAVVQEAALRLAAQGGAALFIDYGYAQVRDGSSLQAVRAHRKVDPFLDPGEADLTALVDFATLAEVAAAQGARWLGTVEQGAFLTALGIDARAAALARRAARGAVEAARTRLVAPDQMGALFKVMGLAAQEWPEAAGFA